METLEQCLADWMETEDLTVAQLTERLGYKSKTTIFRILHGQSNYQSCFQFCGKVMPEMDDDWAERFRHALLVRKMGIQDYALCDVLYRCFFSSDESETWSQEKLPPLPFPPVESGTAVILGCPWENVSALVSALLKENSGIKIIRYFTQGELMSFPVLLSELISNLTTLNYQAVMLDQSNLHASRLTWNSILYSSTQGSCLLLMNGRNAAWHLLDRNNEAVSELMCNLNGQSWIPLYRFDRLKNSTDYIAFTERIYQMEYNCAALIIKPTPGMQMLPPDIVEKSFEDYLAENLEPISAASRTLISIYEKRVMNFNKRKKPTGLILSAEAMIEFAGTGRLADQFFACRPYAPEERIRIIEAIRAFARKKEVTLQFREGNSWSVSAEAYEGCGAVFYPSMTDYSIAKKDYRELFLPGQEFSGLLFQFARELLPVTSDALETEAVFTRMLNAVKE